MRAKDLVRDTKVDIASIASHLDALDDDSRWRELDELGREEQRLLYEKAAASQPIDLAHFTGEKAAKIEVIHSGRNTLPVPPPLKRFQKRFCRPEGGGDRLFGYNEGPTRKLVGPGYFVAVPTKGRPNWEARGAVVVDYFRVPDGAVPASWPRVVPNEQGVQRFVYGGTRDFMRRVSKHVSIGAAYKGEKPLDHYFVLCRR